jgi:hypothetical protein
MWGSGQGVRVLPNTPVNGQWGIGKYWAVDGSGMRGQWGIGGQGSCAHVRREWGLEKGTREGEPIGRGTSGYTDWLLLAGTRNLRCSSGLCEHSRFS